MGTLGHAGSLFYIALAGVVLIVVGVLNGGDWLVLVVGAALLAAAIGLYRLDRPGRRRLATWRPWRDIDR